MRTPSPFAFPLTLVLAIFSLLSPARGDGLIVIHDAPPRPDHFAFAPLEVSYHHVDVQIDGRVAITRVDQEFLNPNPQRLEGTYLFPLPEGATIDKFSMDIDGKETAAELLDADKARSTYEDIVRKYRDPALLEYVGRGAMKVRIFPIEPHGKKHIRLSYTQVLKGDSGLIEYTYPLNTEKFSSRPLKDVSVRVKLACDAPIKSIYCPTHDTEVRRDGDRRATVGFEAKDARPDTDFKLIVSIAPTPLGINLLTYRNGTGDGYYMLLASAGSDVSPGEIQPKDICFVIDTSGSMAGPKLDQAKRALTFCLANLNPGDRFEIIRFSTEAEDLFGHLVPADKANLDKARDFVDRLKPIGGTAIDEALQKAIALATPSPRTRGEGRGEGSAQDASIARPFSIIFLTDGQPTVGEMNEDRIVSRVSSRAGSGDTRPLRIFPFGIGTDINTHLLDRIANDTHAFTQYVLPAEDIEVKVSNFYTKIQAPIITNTKLELAEQPSAGNNIRLTQMYPADLPDLFRDQTVIAFGRYSGSGDATLRLVGSRNGESGTIVETPVNFPQTDTRNAFIPRLWATRRVGWLLDEIRLHGESKELKDEIVQLAREHGIVTPYTAYLILEDERRIGIPEERQTLRELGADVRTRSAISGIYDSSRADSERLEKAGNLAVANSANVQSLKQSANLQAATQPMGLAKPQAAMPGMPGQPAGYRWAQNYAQQVRVVNGRAFYQNGSTWTDNNAATQRNLKRQEVKFASSDYFDLLKQHPDAAAFFALGSEVDVVLGDTLYIVRM